MSDVRCWAFHRWSRWRDWGTLFHFQQRHCERCGIKQNREV